MACTQGSAGPAPHPADDEGLPRHEKMRASPAAPCATAMAKEAARGEPMAYPSAPVPAARPSNASSARLVRRPARRTNVGILRVCAPSREAAEERNVVGNECAATADTFGGEGPTHPVR